MAEMKYTHLEAALRAYGQEVADRYKENLAAAGATLTASLYNTVRPHLERTENGFILYLWMQDYWKYLERGTRMQGPYKKKGDPPPFRAILRWVQLKPIAPWNDKLRRMPQEKAQKSMAFALRHSIWEKGTKPQWFLRDSLGSEAEVEAKMRAAVQSDIEDWINETLAEVR